MRFSILTLVILVAVGAMVIAPLNQWYQLRNLKLQLVKDELKMALVATELANRRAALPDIDSRLERLSEDITFREQMARDLERTFQASIAAESTITPVDGYHAMIDVPTLDSKDVERREMKIWIDQHAAVSLVVEFKREGTEVDGMPDFEDTSRKTMPLTFGMHRLNLLFRKPVKRKDGSDSDEDDGFCELTLDQEPICSTRYLHRSNSGHMMTSHRDQQQVFQVTAKRPKTLLRFSPSPGNTTLLVSLIVRPVDEQ